MSNGQRHLKTLFSRPQTFLGAQCGGSRQCQEPRAPRGNHAGDAPHQFYLSRFPEGVCSAGGDGRPSLVEQLSPPGPARTLHQWPQRCARAGLQTRCALNVYIVVVDGSLLGYVYLILCYFPCSCGMLVCTSCCPVRPQGWARPAARCG